MATLLFTMGPNLELFRLFWRSSSWPSTTVCSAPVPNFNVIKNYLVCGVDTTLEFPFLVTKLSPYYDR